MNQHELHVVTGWLDLHKPYSVVQHIYTIIHQYIYCSQAKLMYLLSTSTPAGPIACKHTFSREIMGRIRIMVIYCAYVNMCLYMYEAADQTAPGQRSSDGSPEHVWGSRRHREGVGNTPCEILHSLGDNPPFQTAIRSNQPLRTDRQRDTHTHS